MLRTCVPAAVGAILSIALGATLWFLIEPRHEPALVWGGIEYTSKQDFTSHLNSLGVDYDAWAARHPRAAPWEPAPAVEPARGNVRSEARTAPADRWTPQLVLAAAGLILATTCALVLTLRWRRVVSSLRRARIAIITARRHRGAASGGSSVLSSSKRLGFTLSRATRRLRPSLPLLPPSSAARIEGRLRPRPMRASRISLGNLAFGLLSLMATGLFALYVAVLLSA